MGLVSESLEQINQDKEPLRWYYKMPDLGKMGGILSIHVTCNHDKGMIALSQEKFIREVLEHYRMTNAHPISTPALANEHLVKLSSSEINTKAYQHALGSLMYPMLETQPDLGYMIAALSHHTANPGPNH
jgi:hypothetical protein